MQNGILRRCQGNRLSLHGNGFGPVIQADAADGQGLWCFLVTAQAGEPAQLGPDPGQHLHRHKGLGDVVVGPHVEAQHLVLGFGFGREQDDGHIGKLPDLCRSGNAVHHRHHHIQQHQMDVLFPNHIHGLPAVEGLKELIPLRGQVDLQRVYNVRLVVANQNPIHGFPPLFLV